MIYCQLIGCFLQLIGFCGGSGIAVLFWTCGRLGSVVEAFVSFFIYFFMIGIVEAFISYLLNDWLFWISVTVVLPPSFLIQSVNYNSLDILVLCIVHEVGLFIYLFFFIIKNMINLLIYKKEVSCSQTAGGNCHFPNSLVWKCYFSRCTQSFYYRFWTHYVTIYTFSWEEEMLFEFDLISNIFVYLILPLFQFY